MWVHKSWFNTPRSLKSSVNIGNIILFKGTVNLISSDSDWYVRFTTIPFKPNEFMINPSCSHKKKKLKWFLSETKEVFNPRKRLFIYYRELKIVINQLKI